jgi:DNA polymerase-3 subunit epsilon
MEVLEGTCWVAHNARFDVNFLLAEFQHAGADIEEAPYRCTLKAARNAFPDLPSKNLEKVCQYLDINMDRAHAALPDARATQKVFERIRQENPDIVSPPSEPFHPDNVTTKRTDPFPRERFEEVKQDESSLLGEMMGDLPSVNADHVDADAYASLLDDVLRDRIVTEEEREELSSLAKECNITPEVAEEIHLGYLKNLIRYTLIDRKITEQERADLEKAQSLLDLQHEDLDNLIKETLEDLEETYGEAQREASEELKGKSVCFTGSLTGELGGKTISRSKAQQLAEENGMIIKGGVTKDLNYLVASDPHSQSNKAEKARNYDIPILAELEFWRKLGVAVK